MVLWDADLMASCVAFGAPKVVRDISYSERLGLFTQLLLCSSGGVVDRGFTATAWEYVLVF